MPLIAAGYLAFAVGLLVGFGGDLLSGIVAASLMAAVAVAATARRTAAALGAILVGGVLLGNATSVADRHCAAGAVRDSSWTVRLHGDAGAGRSARAELEGGGCRLDITLLVARGRARDGSVAAVRGAPVPTRRGMLVRQATVREIDGPSITGHLRRRATGAFDASFREDAPLARALLVADTRSITPELRDRFAAAGLVHALSISGLHVAIIAMAAQLLFRILRFPSRAASAAAVATTVFYVMVIGAPAPAVRAGTMLAVAASSMIVQRPTSPWASLALGALVPLADPRTVLDLGYQLSVAGIAGLIAARSLSRRALRGRLAGWRYALARDLVASTLATLATAPLVAWTFGRVSLIGPVTNLVAAPIIALLQPALFIALLCAPLPSVARFMADAAHPLLVAFDAVARAGAAVPSASIDVSPTLAAAVAAGVATCAGIAACVSRYPARPIIIACAALATIAWLPFIPTRSGLLELHMIDVGQGDAIALRTPRGRWVLFDAGGGWRGGDAGRATVIPYLRRRGGALASLVLSHPHSDHVGGAASVIRSLRPASSWDAAFVLGTDAYRATLGAARESGTAWRRAHPGDSLVLDGVRIAFLAPDSAWTASLSDPNEASAVALVKYGTVRFLLVGDAERAEEAWLLERDVDLRADVLKVGHHGSATSSTLAFLEAVRPSIALISVGAGNRYGHPSADVLRALAGSGADVLRTDLLGSIVVRTDGESLEVEAGDGQWTLSPEPLPR